MNTLASLGAMFGVGLAASAAGCACCNFGYPIRAIANVEPNGKPCSGGADVGSGCTGTVRFEQMNAHLCTVVYEFEGLTPGPHGMHIHETADFSRGCESAGPHYNPHGCSHGGPDSAERHVGDLGNVVADADGVAKGQLAEHHVKLFGEYSVMGRSIIVHADRDDLGEGGHKTSKTTGNSGARVACGEIKAA
eukprot:TRINITY_DN14782_c0_g1_i1.p1 TRINITY_DN14782_c0_g1~~TRINITY_DN14782_c0_g1_i1.p1  ORF type:complete len:192 (-),score=32.62 TRINITY_DN14782_c0_g1_i1:72-647(-)